MDNPQTTFLLVVLAFLLGIVTASGASPEAARIFHLDKAFVAAGFKSHAPPTAAPASTQQPSIAATGISNADGTEDPNVRKIKKAKQAAAMAGRSANGPSLNEIAAEIDGSTQGSQPGREIAAQPQLRFNGQGGFDPHAEEMIRRMNIPDGIKQDILERYRRTGVLPTLPGTAEANERSNQ